MPSYLNDKPKRARKKAPRAVEEAKPIETREEPKEAPREEPRASSNDKSLASELGKVENRLDALDGMLKAEGRSEMACIKAYNSAYIVDTQIALLASAIEDIKRIDELTKESDIYALHSTVAIKLKTIKAQTELMTNLKAVGLL